MVENDIMLRCLTALGDAIEVMNKEFGHKLDRILDIVVDAKFHANIKAEEIIESLEHDLVSAELRIDALNDCAKFEKKEI